MELFSYHLIQAPPLRSALGLVRPGRLARVDGLRHSERFLPMRMGHPVSLPTRYRPGTLAFFALWEDESALDRFLAAPPDPLFERPARHVRLGFYRRWGQYRGLDSAVPQPERRSPEGPVVAVTVARLRLRNTLRFARFGKPVETQVAGHPGIVRATVAFRPPRTFSTFSIWRSEQDMIDMTRGTVPATDGTQHRDAMVERAARPFHSEFTTLRFVPLGERGVWPL